MVTYTAPFSTAQCCPHELLNLIFVFFRIDGDRRSLHSASLVCQQWTNPAQQALLHSVHFIPWKDKHIIASFSNLLVSLKNSQHLRKCVRNVVLDRTQNYPSSWAEILDCSNISTLSLNSGHDYIEEVRKSIQASPVVCGHIKRLVVIRCDLLAYSDTVNRVVANNHNLLSLAICLNPYDSYSTLSPNPSIRRLTMLSSSSKYENQTINFIEAYGKNLERLDLILKMTISQAFLASLVKAMSKCSNLTAFHFEANIDYEDERCPLPLVDYIMSSESLPALEYLSIGGASYTAEAFNCIPPTVKTLVLEGSCSGHIETEGLTPFLKSQTLTSLTIQPRTELAKPSLEECMKLRNVCENVGVEFSVAKVTPFGSTFAQLFAVEID